MITLEQKTKLDLAFECLYKAKDILDRQHDLSEEEEMAIIGYAQKTKDLMFEVIDPCVDDD